MPDVVDEATRSRMMAAIKGKNTKPEILVRSALHASGFRYKLHDKKLPGKPDIVLPRYNAVIFVQGCFWHGHECSSFRWPATRRKFWRNKIEQNVRRDHQVKFDLKLKNWRIAEIWECALRGKKKLEAPVLTTRLIKWLESGRSTIHFQEKVK